jgi:glyoxylase-like metal-dependent hydrolase (beta-lactamase superfamily II)
VEKVEERVVTNTGQIADSIYLIDVYGYGLRGMISLYILKGEKTVVLDSGTADSTDGLMAAMSSLGINFNSVRYIMVSHRHHDHAGGAAILLKHFPNAQVGVHEFAKKHLMDPSKVNEGAREVFGRFAVPMESIKDEGKILTLEENRTFQVGVDHELEIVYTPGHTSDHFAFYEKKTGLLFCGDAVGTFGPISKTITPTSFPPSFKYNNYTTSIMKLLTYDVNILAFPHFGAVIGSGAKAMLRRGLEVAEDWKRFVDELRGKNLGEYSVSKALQESCLGELEIFPASIRGMIGSALAQGFLMGI